MIPTVAFLRERFDYFNNLIFGSSLPEVPVKLSKARRFLGNLRFTARRTLTGKIVKSDFVIRISVFYDRTCQEIEDTLIHEMIHLHIHAEGIKDTSPHGVEFRRIMKHVNRTYGRNISISERTGDNTVNPAAVSHRRQNVVAVVLFKDGKTGFKVLPKVRKTILHYYKTVGQTQGVESIHLYLTDNPFFQSYPRSGALKVYYISREELALKLDNASQLVF